MEPFLTGFLVQLVLFSNPSCSFQSCIDSLSALGLGYILWSENCVENNTENGSETKT